MAEHKDLFPEATHETSEHRSRLAPGPAEAFRAFSKAVFADGAIPTKTKQLVSDTNQLRQRALAALPRVDRVVDRAAGAGANTRGTARCAAALQLLLLPERRPQRAYPRVVKIKMSKFNKKWVNRPQRAI